MDKWKALSQALKNVGSDFADSCRNLGVTVRWNPEFDELYICYAMLLEIMKTTRQVIASRFEEIDSAE